MWRIGLNVENDLLDGLKCHFDLKNMGIGGIIASPLNNIGKKEKRYAKKIDNWNTRSR